jgi:hypothetical protein
VGGRWRLTAACGGYATALVLTTFVFTACHHKGSPISPSGGPQVTGVTPGAGTTVGGTLVTISGSGFSGAGATVTIGGAPATNVAVVTDSAITASTPQHASGSADVMVSVGGKTATLPNGYSYAAAAQTDNQAPVISGIIALGTKAHEPKAFADLDEEINVTATVTDKETPLDQLEYQWSAPAGGFTGTGATVRWRAPHAAGAVGLTLTVVERYQATDGAGRPVSQENRTASTLTVGVHDSAGEVADMANAFMLEFSKQSPSPSQIVRNFYDGCSGKRAENDDVTNNQNRYVIQSYHLDPAQVKLSFGGTCDNTSHGARSGDACAYVGATWHSLDKTTNKTETVVGTDQLNSVFDGSRWWLCNSDFFGKSSNPIAAPATGLVPGRFDGNTGATH